MSIIQNDKLEKRKNKLEGVEVPLRDQIVTKLYNKLDEMNIGQKIVTMYETGLARRSVWNARQQAWLGSWDEFLLSDTSSENAGSSQLHIPVPFIVCKTIHARFLQAINQTPPFNIKAQNSASVDNLPIVRDLIAYYLNKGCNHHQGIFKTIDNWVWDWVTMGSGIIKARWAIEYSKFVDVKKVRRPGPPQVMLDEQSNEQVIPTLIEEEVEFDNIKKCFDGPVFELKDIEDVLIIGGGGCPQQADGVIERAYLTASQLWTYADREIFDADVVNEVIEGGADEEDTGLNTDLKQQRTYNAGKSTLNQDNDLDRYEILEAYIKVDVDNSGINSDVIVWVHRKSRKLLRATYLYRVSKRGRRPYFKIDFQPRKNQEYGIGLPEMLYPLSKEMDAIHNMRIDYGMLSVMPFGFYRASSGIEPTTLKLEPGALIPCDNPQTDIYFPNLGNRTSFGFQEEAAIQQIIERLTSISDVNLGVVGGQGVTRTASGTRALMGEMSSNLDVYLQRLNNGWSKLLEYLLEALQRNIPTGVAYRLTGDNNAEYFQTINDAKDIDGDFDIEISANSSSSNSGIQAETATQIYQMVQNPLAIQMGAITPGNFYAALENYLRAMGVKDFAKYVTKPQGYQIMLSPEDEANRILRGIHTPVTPGMDHQGFLDYFEHIVKNDDLFGQFTEEQTIQLANQAKQHEQMLQAMEQAAAQQANANQMRINQNMGAPQTMQPNQYQGPGNQGGGQQQ